MKKLRLLIVISFLFVSCTDNSNNSNTTTIDGVAQVLSEERVYKVTEGVVSVSHLDSLFLVSTIPSLSGHLFSVYNKTGNIISEFGEIGDAPGHFSEMVKMQDYKEGAMYIFDHGLLKLIEVDFEGSTSKAQMIKSREYLLPRELLGVQEAYLINDSLIAGILDDTPYSFNGDGKKRIFRFNYKSGRVETKDLRKFSVATSDILIQMNVNARVVDALEDRSKIVIASVYTPIVEIYDIKTNSVRELNFGNENNFIFDPLEFKDNQYDTYSRYVRATEDKFYLLFSSDPLDHVHSKNLIKSYNWDGTLYDEYNLPENVSFTVFDINSSGSEIIGINFLEDKLYKFSLKP